MFFNYCLSKPQESIEEEYFENHLPNPEQARLSGKMAQLVPTSGYSTLYYLQLQIENES